MPTIVGILTFMSMINFMLSWGDHEKSFITSRPGSWTLVSTGFCYLSHFCTFAAQASKQAATQWNYRTKFWSPSSILVYAGGESSRETAQKRRLIWVLTARRWSNMLAHLNSYNNKYTAHKYLYVGVPICRLTHIIWLASHKCDRENTSQRHILKVYHCLLFSHHSNFIKHWLLKFPLSLNGLIHFFEKMHIRGSSNKFWQWSHKTKPISLGRVSITFTCYLEYRELNHLFKYFPCCNHNGC